MRIYCLSSITAKNVSNIKSKSPESIKNEEIFYPENNTKTVLERIKNDPKILNSYQLTEICIGYHFIPPSDEKVYLLLIYRKDTNLIVIKMEPNIVSFHSITGQVFEFNIFTSKFFPATINFDLIIRFRCIKNTQVRGPITENEIQLYENYAKEIESLSKNEPDLQESAFGMTKLTLPNESLPNVLRTKISDIKKLVELLCDPETGNVENVPEKSRYNQKVKCLSLKSETTKTESNVPNAEKPRKMVGRPPKYSTDEDRRRVHAETSRKYSYRKTYEFNKLKEHVSSMEEDNRELNKTLQNLKNEYQKLHEEGKDTIHYPSPKNTESSINLHISPEQPSSKNVEPQMASNDTSEITNETLIIERHYGLSKISKSVALEKNLHNYTRGSLAVKRCRERKIEEAKRLEERKESIIKENEILKEQIKSIKKLAELMNKSVEQHMMQHSSSKTINTVTVCPENASSSFSSLPQTFPSSSQQNISNSPDKINYPTISNIPDSLNSNIKREWHEESPIYSQQQSSSNSNEIKQEYSEFTHL